MTKELILGIDASNIRGGGGVTHLVELLKAEGPIKEKFSKVIIWGGKVILEKIQNEYWLIKRNPELLNGNLLQRTYWQKFKLAISLKEEQCDILFVPGGSFSCNYRPIVTFSQNMLPFQKIELLRYGFSWMTLKMLFLRVVQASSFRKADGVIFLNNFAKNAISKEIGKTPVNYSIIPHGINSLFFNPPREQKAISSFSFQNPFEILYLSIIDVYKHQCIVAEAIAKLRKKGLPINIRFVGPAYPPALKRLQKKMLQLDPEREFIHYDGQIDHSYLPDIFKRANIFLFASSCENMPNILLEAMAAGLPIVSSNRGPMPEVLGSGGLYFNPEDPVEIAEIVAKFIDSPELRKQKSLESYKIAQQYSWSTCASQTAQFLDVIARKHNTKKKNNFIYE